MSTASKSAITGLAGMLALAFIFLFQSAQKQQVGQGLGIALPAVDPVQSANAGTPNPDAPNEAVATASSKARTHAIHPKAAGQPAEADEAEEEAEEGGLSKAQRIEEALKEEEMRTRDQALGYVPRDRFLSALELTRRRQTEMMAEKTEARGNSIARSKWTERGPSNVGGRTGALLLDLNDPSRKSVFVGCCTGGLWKTSDITAARPVWKQVNDYLANLSIGSIAQDPRNPKIMYLGTGDPSADDVRGIGIFKSTDGGNTWSMLANTLNRFTKVREIVVTNNGVVYAGTSSGIFRSTDEGASWTSVLSQNIWDLIYIPSSGMFYASTDGTVYRSATGNQFDWSSLASKAGFPSGLNRLEIAVANSQPNILYLVGARGNASSNVYKTIDGGDTWTIPGTAPSFTSSQAWYDLDIIVDPSNPDRVFAGGLDLYLTANGGASWSKISSWSDTNPQYVHADQHNIIFDPDNSSKAYFGNDGGIWATTNSKANLPPIDDKNTGYNTTLFYYGAIHPGENSNYFLGGAQDNGSININEADIATGRSVLGGDGFWCHIDQDEPNIQFVSLYFGNFSVTIDGGKSFSKGVTTQGKFYSFGAYDDKNNVFYAQSNSCAFYRWSPTRTDLQTGCVTVSGATIGELTSAKADPNIPYRLYLGDRNGYIVRVDSAHKGTTVNGVQLARVGGVVSSIDVEVGNPDHLLVAISNYGVANSIVESTDGGKTWVGVEGTAVPNNLPDVPVRWAIFNPNDASQAMIATEVGVWTTDLLDGANTRWDPPVPGRGTPLVRTNHLEVRASDNIVMAATYGRGIFTSDAFTTPNAKVNVPTVHYTNSPLKFRSASRRADSFSWNFGDGTTDSIENPFHTYSKVGTFPVSLTINNSLTDIDTVKILPDQSLPYLNSAGSYGGNFDAFPEQYGVYTVSGSSFQRGRSTQFGKSGVRSGSNAYVVGLNEQYYQPNTLTMLYLPNFNFKNPGIYEFSFFAKYTVQFGPDGFLVEYSTDRGQTWNILGGQQSGWYNYTSDGSFSAFPKGVPYFTGNVSQFTKYSINVSDLSGNENVAFRIVFKSDDSGNHPGMVIDDVEITKYDGELRTNVVEQSAAFNGATTIDIKWQTYPEYNCKQFEVEWSENGRDFSRIFLTNAKGGTTANVLNYAQTKEGANKALYFIRIKVVNENASLGYKYTFYTPVMVVRRDIEGTDVFNYFPNPFRDYVDFTFNNVVTGEVKFELFDDSGRLVHSSKQQLDNDVYARVQTGGLAKGVYVLRVTIGDSEPKSFKLIGGFE